jgi:hypothetical protein
MPKFFLRIYTQLIFSLIFLTVPAWGQNNVEVNVIGPFELSPQNKEYHYGFNETNPDSNQYFLELVNGDGKDLKTIDCKKKKSIFKFFCVLENKIYTYIYDWHHVTQAQVKINNKQVIKSNEISGKGIIVKSVSLKDQNSIKLKIKGHSGAKVQVRIYKKIIDQVPVAQFISSVSNTNSNQIDFDASQSTDNGSIVNYEWDFGDGNYGTGVQISHVYGSAGSYIVTLKVTDNIGFSATVSETIILIANNNIPSIDWIIQEDQSPYPVIFYPVIGNASVPVVSYEINYGDGVIDSFDNTFSFVEHKYQTLGLYNVDYKVTGSNGAVKSGHLVVDIQNIDLPNIVLNGGPFSGPSPLTVNLDVSQSISSSPISYIQWDLTDDGIYNPTLTGPTLNKVFIKPGLYNLFVEVGTANHRKRIHYFTIEVLQPDYDYGLNIIASQIDSSERSVSFDSQFFPLKVTSSWPVSDVSYEWDLGDGNSLSGKQITHSFNGNGPYEIVLKANIPNQKPIYSFLTINNLSLSQNFPTPEFLIIGNNGPAPLSVQLDATRYAKLNPQIKNYIWSSDSGIDFPNGPNSFYRFGNQGSHELRLTIINDNGFSKTSESQNINVNGIKNPISSIVRSRYGSLEGRPDAGPVTIYKLPALVNFNSEQSFSENGDKLKTTWNLNGQTLEGESVYFQFLNIGNYTIQYTTQDNSGNIISDSIDIQIPSEDCEMFDGENICPEFKGYKDKILPFSQNQWVLSTNINSSLLSVAEQIDIQGDWASIYDESNQKKYDISHLLTLNGSDLVLNKSDLISIGLDIKAEFNLSISLYDENQEQFQGTIYPLKFGIGSAAINVPSNTLINVLSVENNYFKQFKIVNAQTINLSNLASGKYSVVGFSGEQITSKSFEIADTSLVSIDLNNNVQLKSLSLGTLAIKAPQSPIKPTEMTGFINNLMKGYLTSASRPDYSSYEEKNQTDVSRVSTLLADPSLYPSWTKQFCNNNVPTHLPLAINKRNEFIIEGIKSWTVGKIDLGDGNILGDLINYNRLPQDSLKLKNGKRVARFVCYIQGNIHLETSYYKFIEGKKCCADQACRDSQQQAYNYYGLYSGKNDKLPVYFKFNVRDPVTGKTYLAKERSESFNSATRLMNLNNKSDIINYFGISVEGNVIPGVWAPTFWVDVPIPDDIVSPELKIDLIGYPKDLPSNFTAHGYGCILPQYDGYRPEITKIGGYQKISKKADSFNLNPIQVRNGERVFNKIDGGRLPLNWDVKFDTTKPNPFDSKFPIEIEILNGFGVQADKIKMKIESNGDSFEQDLTNSDFELLEQYINTDNGQQYDRYRILLDVNKYESNFRWNLTKLLDTGAISFQGEWNTFKSSTIKSEEFYESKNVSYNLAQAEDSLCSNGFYSNYNPFASPAFFKKYREVDSAAIKGRCNDIGHPFGGKFEPHNGDGHMFGYGIDMRYPLPDGLGVTQDEMDRIPLGGKNLRTIFMEKIVSWINSLEQQYYPNSVASASHSNIFNICNQLNTNRPLACNHIATGSLPQTYTKESIFKFCHLLNQNFSDTSLGLSYSDVCLAFPFNEAKIISLSTEAIRKETSAVASINPNATFVFGIGQATSILQKKWLEDLLFGGRLNKNYELLIFDLVNDNFLENSFGFWINIPKTDKSNNIHNNHMHMDLK